NLQTLTGDNPEQQRRLAGLAADFASWEHVSRRSISGAEPAGAVASTLSAEDTVVGSIETRIADTQRAEEALLHARSAAAGARVQQFSTALYLMAGLGLLVLALALLAVLSANRQSARAETASETASALLADRVRQLEERTGELVFLSEAVQ